MTSQLISSLFLALHWLIVVVLSVRVIARRPPVGVSLAWLAVIASTPFIGAVIYLLFGEKRLGRRRAERIAEYSESVEHWQSLLRDRFDRVGKQVGDAGVPIYQHAERVLGYPVLSGNSFELLSDFGSVFDALVADIDAAQTRCHLCFYIWHEGGRVNDVVDALVRAAGRGVQCRALADDIGSEGFLNGDQAQHLRDAGVELIAALPTGLVRTLFIRRDLRNHRKIVVIDDRIAYTGSQNLVDPRYFKQDYGLGEWVDAVVRLTGPTASVLDGVFALDWSIETGSEWEQPSTDDEASAELAGSMIQIVPSGPGPHPEAIHQLLLTAIYAARSELVMTTPYFIPDASILTALISAALRGVEVTLIVPAHNDSFLVRYASVANFDELMSAGVQIAQFEGGLLHTKSLTIDGSITVFGSVNLDTRSLWLNFEISLFAYDESFTKKVKELQNNYFTNSTLLDLEIWRERPSIQRFGEDAFRLLSPLL
ncbi:MAG: cardiolipin synthase [Cryomorphaceae bacterium]|jgi:cardiolipin synthase